MLKKLFYMALLAPIANFAQPVLNENFEGAAFPPAGWTIQQTNPTNTWELDTSGSIGELQSLKVHYTASDQDEWLISPSFDLSGYTAGTLRFFFSGSYYWGVSPNNNSDTFAKISTDGGATWTTLWNEEMAGEFSDYQNLYVNLNISAYVGNPNVKIAFEYVGNDGDDVFIDDVKVTDCMPPTNPVVTNVTGTTATLNFSGTTHDYTLTYVYLDPLTQIEVPLTTESYNFTGLQPGKTYFCLLQSNCSPTSSSEYTEIFTFTTSCDIATVPYTLDFDSSMDFPSCTSVENVGDGNPWDMGDATVLGYTGYSLVYPYNSSNPANTWFYTEGVQLTAGQTYTISYAYGAASAFYPEKLKVAYGTSPSAAAMTNLLADYPNVIDERLNDTITFTPSVSGPYYFGFNAYSDADMYYLVVDDIHIEEQVLGIPDSAMNSFKFWPNPVKNVLNLSYDETISKVEVYNMLGQLLHAENGNTSQKQIDMASLIAGNYMVKVYCGNNVKTLKVVKE